MYKFNNENINKSVFETEFNNKSSYYGNVVMWTTMFSLPLFFLFDYLFYSDGWLDLVYIRLIGFGLSFLVYTLFRRNHWSFEKTITWFVAINVIVQAFICGVVPSLYAFPFFIMLAIYLLIVCNTIFWNPRKSIIIFLASLIVICLLYYFKNNPDKFSVMISNGCGIYIALGLIACLLSYTRFNSVCKDIENDVVNGKLQAIDKQATQIRPLHTFKETEPKILPIETDEIKHFVSEKVEDKAIIEQKPIELAQSVVEEKIETTINELTTTEEVEPLKNVEPDLTQHEVEEKLENSLSVAEVVAPAVTVIAPIVSEILDDKKEVNESVEALQPTEKPKKSIHEEIEDTIRLLRGEKPKEEFTTAQNFVANTFNAPEIEAKADLLDTPQVRETNTIEPEINYNFDTSSVTNHQIVENIDTQISNEVAQVEPLSTIEESSATNELVERESAVTPQISIVNEAVISNVAKEKINLNEVVETSIIDLIDTIHLKDQSIQLNISPAPNYVFHEKNSLNKHINTIIQHVLRYSPSGSIITCNADKENGKAVVELTSHAAVDSGEKLKAIAENYKTQGAQAINLVESVGLGAVKEEIEKVGGSLYYNHADDNSNYLKLELPSTQ